LIIWGKILFKCFLKGKYVHLDLNNSVTDIYGITCISGTPGTGKTTLAGLLLRAGHSVYEIEDFARTRGIYSHIENGETLVIDVPDLVSAMAKHLERAGRTFVVGHLSHNLANPESVVVLRTKPSVLRRRLAEKGWGEEKVSENVEAEALDICLGEALELHGEKVSEIDTTDISPETVMKMVLDVHLAKRRYPPQARNWLLDHILEESKG
jgi:adenylate kinase